jgi:hypothetical protein
MTAGISSAYKTAEILMQGRQLPKGASRKVRRRRLESVGLHRVHKQIGHGRKSTGETEGQFARDLKGRRGQYGGAGNPPLIVK